MIVYLLVDDYPAWGDLSPLQVLAKPGSGKPCDFFERARFFKQMCRARNNLQFFLALKLRVSLLVQLDDHFVAEASRGSVPVATGTFRAHMAVALVNDGPVTLILDTTEWSATG